VEVLGTLKDATVLIDRADNTLILSHPDMGSIKFSIDHPYLKGTKLERHARAFLDQPKSQD
jgi:hypothetical protein